MYFFVDQSINSEPSACYITFKIYLLVIIIHCYCLDTILGKQITCCYTVPLYHVARPWYPGCSLSGGVPQSRVENQDQSEWSTSNRTLQVGRSVNWMWQLYCIQGNSRSSFIFVSEFKAGIFFFIFVILDVNQNNFSSGRSLQVNHFF